MTVERLTVAYGTHFAVKDLSVEVGAGEIVAVIGSNGMGKSSTLLGMVGMAPVRNGILEFEGKSHDLRRTSAGELARAGIVLCPEGRQLFGDLSVIENLKLGAIGAGAPKAEAAARLNSVFEVFPALADRPRQTARTMSGGEQQMLAIGRALMAQPKVLLLDEPSLGLAPTITTTVFEALVELVDSSNLAVLLVEQNVRATLQIAARIYLMVDGEIALEGTSAELKDDPRVSALYLGTATEA